MPTPFVVEFAKKVNDWKQKFNALVSILNKKFEKPNPKLNFFRVKVEEIADFFDLFDGNNLGSAKKQTKIVLNITDTKPVSLS